MVGLGVYYTVAESLPNFTIWWEVAILALLVIPAVFGLVYFALPLWPAPGLLLAGLATVVLAALLQIAASSCSRTSRSSERPRCLRSGS